MTDLFVGPSEQYHTLAAAIAASAPGDTINIDSGTYENDFATITHPLTIFGNGGPAILVATTPLPDDGAILTIQADVTLNGVNFQGANAANHRGTAIRYEGGDLMIQECNFDHNEAAILGLAAPTGHVTLDGVDFTLNGSAASSSDNVAFDEIASLSIANSYFLNTFGGNHLTSAAHQTSVVNSLFYDGAGSTSRYAVDLPKGGNAEVFDSTLVQSDTSLDPAIIHFGGNGTPYAGSSLTVQSVAVVDYHPNGVLVFNETNIVAEISNNILAAVETVAIGPNNQDNNVGPTVRNLTGDSGSDLLFGSYGDDTLNGLGGDDQLQGSYGNDSMIGGPGNDTFDVDTPNDQVIELANQGNDTVISVVSFTLPDNVEILFLQSLLDLNGAGNGLDNQLFGNRANNTLSGLAGNDSLFGDDGADLLLGGDGNDSLAGGTGNDTLQGGNGNDMLYGEVGNNSMVGGDGDDAYYVGSSGDMVVELDGQGNDTVISSVDFTLPDPVETMQLDGTNNTGTGNGRANVIIGDGGNNVLNGLAGNDTLFGQFGNDLIQAGDGDDIIIGGSDNDTILAGDGNDLMTGDLPSGNDSIDAGAGNDTVLAQTGADTIIGGDGNDLIGVFNGTDTISGGAGNDVVLLADGTHTVDGGEGNDTVAIFGGNGDSILGGAGDDAFFSGGTNATLEGGAGSDVFLGGDGPDTFAYHSGFGPSDLIYLFTQGSDKIRLAANINGTGIATPNDALTHVSATTLNGIGPAAQVTLGAEVIYVVGLQSLQASDFAIG